MNRLLLVALLLTALAVRGQTYFNERVHASPVYSGAVCLVLNGNGYLAVGRAPDTLGRPGRSLLLAFVDSTGQLERTRFFHRPNVDIYPGSPGSLLRLPQGGFVTVGTGQDTAGRYSGLLWRFDARGDTLWSRIFTSPAGLELTSLCPTADGGWLLIGAQHLSSTTAATDVLLICTDSAGAERWRRTYDERYEDFVQCVTPTPDGGFLVTGFTIRSLVVRPYDPDWLLLKVDSAGQEQWRRLLGGAFADGAGQPLPTTDGGYVVTGAFGESEILDRPQTRPALVKLDSAGQVQWQRTYGPARLYTGTLTLRALADGNYLLAGQGSDTTGAWGTGNGFPEGLMVKICSNGDSLWYRTYKKLMGGHSHNYLRDVQPTADGGFVATGFVLPVAPDTGTQDIWLMKTDSAGYLAPGGPPVTATCRPLGVVPVPERPEAVTIFPNPSADGRFTLRLEQVPATLTVTDALGRAVLTASCEPRTANLELDLSRQPPGVYALRVTWPDGRTVTRRLVR